MKHLNHIPRFLLGATFLTELVYLFIFTLPFPLITFYTAIPPLDYTKITAYSGQGLIAFVVGIFLLFAIYIWLLKATLPRYAPYLAIIFALTLLFSYPVLAIDIFVYAIWSRGWGLYGLNPLATSADMMPMSDPWLGLAGEWYDRASPYGPIWEVLALGAYNVSNGHFLWHVIALKVIVLLAYIAAIFLIGLIFRTLHSDWEYKGMMAFAWNPLVLFEVAQNGHNDMVMILLLLMAIYALLKAKDYWVVPLMALSVSVKLISILAAPFFILSLSAKQVTWPRRLIAFILYTVIFIGIIVLFMVPLWPGLDNWAILKANSGAGRSLLALSVLMLKPWVGISFGFDISQFTLYATWGLIILGGVWQKRHHLSEPLTAIHLAWLALFCYVLLLAPVFHAWYILWFLPLGIILWPHQAKVWYASVVFSFTALLIIPYFETIRVWYPILLQNQLLGHGIALPLLLGPPVWAVLNKRIGE